LQINAGSAASDQVEEIAVQCNNLGIGVARYGSLAGRAHAEASSTPANPLLAGGQLVLDVGYADGVQVLSDTLDPGTPVTLAFLMTLEATAFHFIDGSHPNPPGTGAAARHELEIRDLDDISVPFGEGALTINSRGMNETLRTVEFDTAVGHRLEIVVDLFVSAGANIDYPQYDFTQATAEVLAEQTAELFYQPSGDVRLVSESGHDYVPEPGWGALLSVSAMVLLLRRRQRRSSCGMTPAYP
jgi:hypothetical protein